MSSVSHETAIVSGFLTLGIGFEFSIFLTAKQNHLNYKKKYHFIFQTSNPIEPNSKLN